MRNILWLVLLFFAVTLMSCAGENRKMRGPAVVMGPQKECFHEDLPHLMMDVRTPKNFQTFYEALMIELDTRRYRAFIVNLEQGKHYLVKAKVLPAGELIYLRILKDGEKLAEDLSSEPQLFFSLKISGEYRIFIQVGPTECRDKVLFSLAVAERK